MALAEKASHLPKTIVSKQRIYLLIFAVFAIAYVSQFFFTKTALAKADPHYYPNFLDNPQLDERMKTVIAPYLLPLEHPAKPFLDSIFSKSRVIASKKALAEAGFYPIISMPISFITFCKHPSLPGYVFKFYLDSETRTKDNILHWECLVKRCQGAERIRNIIKEYKIRNFVVPEKWIYLLPANKASSETMLQPIILIETDMEVKNEKKTRKAWQSDIQKKHLDELYIILKKGCGSTALHKNLPYTKKGKFAFIDTEHLERQLDLSKVNRYLSEDMQNYWNYLITDSTANLFL